MICNQYLVGGVLRVWGGVNPEDRGVPSVNIELLDGYGKWHRVILTREDAIDLRHVLEAAGGERSTA